jgi:anti-sigma regulatory factor (Ser/Thr protein kinase)
MPIGATIWRPWTPMTAGEVSVEAAGQPPESAEPIIGLFQETLHRAMASRSRIERDTLVPYAIAPRATSSLQQPSVRNGPGAPGDSCRRPSPTLMPRRSRRALADDERVTVSTDADVVRTRQKAREAAAAAGFTGTELTVIATAVSEIARNVVKFAKRGEFVISVVTEGDRNGLHIVARDSGPGISDVARALEDGYSTYRGLGLGLPGARRLMDEFDIVSEVGGGTTITMIKWRA